MKKFVIYSLLCICTMIQYSCASFLDEESYESDTALFEDEVGLKSLVYLSYSKIYILLSCDPWIRCTEFGADLFLRGALNTEYDLTDLNGLTSYNNSVTFMWNLCYKALANSFMFFENIDNTPFENEAEKKQITAEMHVMHALYLWLITETWEDSYLPRSTDEKEGSEARRSPRSDFYSEIINRLETAISMLPDSRTTEYGRIDKPTAKAFLARVYLYNEEFDKAAQLASEVIDGPYGYELCPSLKDLWSDSKRNDEFIWSLENSSDDTFRQGATVWYNFAMYIDRFPGVKTERYWTAYGGSGAIPTLYYLSLFNKEADLRWSDLHQWVWYYNDPEDDTTQFPQMQQLYVDTALYLSVDPIPAEEKLRMKRCYTAFDINDMYDENGVPKDRHTFIGMTKFYDHTRPGDMAAFSDRNYPFIRLAELYLIRAEARMRSATPDMKGALEDIRTLRKRATRPGYEAEMEVNEEDLTLEFILEERGRELAGEWQRRNDLKRMGKLIEHVKIYNPDAAPYMKEYHLKRPIPQSQLDGMPDWTTLGQNEGY